uniref:Major facilitator superfamily (MFS) profile domain-containing protein n=1 Tax=Parascaris univalens TaxID=6257 RepID=A0A915AUX1_PARUN
MKEGTNYADEQTSPTITVSNMWRIPLTSKTIRPSIAKAYSLSVLYNVSFFSQMTMLPYTAKRLAISDTDFGLLQTFFGVMQMFGGPLYGYLIRRIGIRNALILCYSCTIASSLITFAATDKSSLYMSILPSVFMHGQQGHQTLLSTLTRPGKERTNAFSRMGITFGLGFIFTPLVTTISRRLFSDEAPLITSAIIGAIAIYIVAAYLRLERPNDDEEEMIVEDKEEKKRKVTIELIVNIAHRPGVAVTFVKKCALITPMLLTTSITQIYMINTFQLTPEMNSFLQIFVGIIIMFNNGFVVVWLRQRFNEEFLLTMGAIVCLIGYVLHTQWYELWIVFCTIPFTCLAMSIVGTVADSLLTSLVHVDEQALILGALHAVNSLTRTFGPAMAGYMLERFGFSIFGLIGTAMSTIILIYDLIHVGNRSH